MSETNLGPIDYFIVEFPDSAVTADGFAALIDLVDRGSVYIIDIEFVRKDAENALATVAADSLAAIDGLDLGELSGAATKLLDADDLAFIGEAIAVGSTAAVVVYEQLSIATVFDAFAAGGGRMVASGPVDVDDLDSALDQ